MQCTNNLKQLGIAMHNFHSSKNRLTCGENDPDWISFKKPGTTERLDAVDIYSPFCSLLPYIEQNAVFETLTGMLSKASSTSPYNINLVPQTNISNRNIDGGTDNNPFMSEIPGYMCPTDPNVKKPSGQPQYTGATSYHCNRGDAQTGSNWGETRGLFPNGTSRIFTLANVADGTSNTVLFAESAASSPSNDRRVVSGIANLGTAIRTTVPSSCAATRGDAGMLNTTDLYSSKGRRWPDARQVYTMFNTILPPNSPSCQFSGEREVLVTASSFHSGGANVALVDGSVKFVSDTIDCGTITQYLGYGYTGSNPAEPHQWTGQSTYGIWGAAGTSNGGESKTLP